MPQMLVTLQYLYRGFRVGMGDCGVQAQNVGNSQNFTTCFGDVHTVFPY